MTSTTSLPTQNSPIVGVLGCMAERLKHRLLESDKLVDIVAGPDAYRDLPRLIDIVQQGTTAVLAGDNEEEDTNHKGHQAITPYTSTHSEHRMTAINVQLSLDETYADVVPVRLAGTRSVYLSVMRGCNNMCAFCVVPFTRGRERSRPLGSILDEVTCIIAKLSLI